MVKIVGEICEKFSSFEWKIQEFSSLSTNPGDYYKSPQFELFDEKWTLSIYPNGKNEESTGWISLYMSMEIIQTANHSVFFKTSIKGRNGKEFISYKTTLQYNEENYSWGYRKYFERSEILKNSQEIAPDGILTISVAISWDRCDEKYNASPSILWENLVSNLKDAFLKQRNCDIVIKAKNKEFQAHSIILGARSKVFEEMIEKSTVESFTSVVVITDTEPDVFRSFLLYLYSGDIKQLSSENVCGLYALSKEHDLKDLREACVKYIECNLSVEIICEVLLLCEKYEDIDINESAKTFLFKNVSAVLSGGKWESFEAENIMLANKTLKSIILDKVSKMN